MRRYRIIAGVGARSSLAVLAWVLAKLGEKGQLTAAKWSPFLHADRGPSTSSPG